MSKIHETSTHHGQTVLWQTGPDGTKGIVGHVTVTIERMPSEARPFSIDRKVLAFAKPRFRAKIHDALADPVNVFQTSMSEAKDKGVALAMTINAKIEQERETRRQARRERLAAMFALTNEISGSKSN